MLEALGPYLAPDDRELIRGAGDDAAVWQPPGGAVVVTTTDSLVEGAHFRSPLDAAAAVDLGWKLLAVSLSDLAAMGATPGPAFISLALPDSWRLRTVIEIYEGLRECCIRHDVLLAGGNITSAPGAVLTSTCLGAADPARVLLRTGVMPGWQLGLTGSVGGAAAALRTQFDGGPRNSAPSQWALRKARPEPRLEAGRTLAAAGITAALDVSDGLFVDAGRLLGAEAGGVVIDAAALPLDVGIRDAWPDGWLDVAGGGEDYELLFAGPPETMEAAMLALRLRGVVAAVIGVFGESSGVRVSVDGLELAPPATGHRHFA